MKINPNVKDKYLKAQKSVITQNAYNSHHWPRTPTLLCLHSNGIYLFFKIHNEFNE